MFAEFELKMLLKQHRGRDNPIYREELENITGLQDRAIRDLISDFRRQGNPIVSLKKGYFWASPSERDAYIKRETSRAKKILYNISGLKPEVETVTKQLEMFE